MKSFIDMSQSLIYKYFKTVVYICFDRPKNINVKIVSKVPIERIHLKTDFHILFSISI